ncbi:MAG: trypsin-like peptidase domain-containing protein [Magnetococcales bacterium]|nr:trypsin-like peptidase domain-containing protein [Magnetococcales bacterium]
MTPEQDPNCGRGFLKYLFMVGAAAILLLVGTFWWDRHTPGGFYSAKSGDAQTGQVGAPPAAGPVGPPVGPVGMPVAATGAAGSAWVAPDVALDGSVTLPGSTPSRFAAVSRALLPSVVNVSVTSTRLPEGDPAPATPAMPHAAAPSPLPNVPAAPNAPGAPTTPNQDPGLQYASPFSGVKTESIGSGVVVTEDGYILSNYHVVEKAKHVYVTLFNAQGGNQVLPAEMVTLDAKRDLALLKIDPETPLQPAAFGDSALLSVGDPVIAIGSPFGLDQTVSRGIISGKRKAVDIGGVLHRGLIQTDAAINRGNSGGPLVDGRGYVIGINTAIYTTTNAFAGVGFAVPSNTAREFLEETLRLPVVTPNLSRPDVLAGGAHIAARPPPPIQANATSPHGDRGPCVQCHEILSATPGALPVAARTAPRIQANAAMPHADWGPCTNCHEILPVNPGALPAAFNQGGASGAIGAWHRSRADALSAFNPRGMANVTPGMALAHAVPGGAGVMPPAGMPGAALGIPVAAVATAAPGTLQADFGLTLTVLDAQGARQRQLSVPKGMLVDAVQPGSVADQAGLRAGDVLLKVEGRWADNLDVVEQRLARAKPGDEVRLAVVRGTARQPVYLRIPSRTDKAVVSPGQPQAWNVAMTAPIGAQQWGPLPLPLQGEALAPSAGQGVVNKPVGVVAKPLPPAEFEWMGLEMVPPRPGAQGPRGGTVQEVTPGSPGARGGLRVGDVVLAINGSPTPDAAAMDQAIKATAGRQWTLLEVERGGVRMFAKLQ